MMRTPNAVADVAEILETQRRALLAGDLAGLARMGEKLDRAMQHLIEARPPEADIARLRDTAAHNSRLIAAAGAGIARIRDSRRRAGPGSLTTYDAQGRQSDGRVPGQTLLRR